jgi:septum formation protein
VLVLASASPRRRELLRLIQPEFDVVPGDVDEALDGPVSAAVIRSLAERKARAVAGRTARGVVLGADTVVIDAGEPLGKPRDPGEAREMLRRLRGRAHEVVTGLAVVDASTGRSATAAARTVVVMARYDDALIEAYVASGAPLDKAGAYGIQDLDGALVSAWIGSYSNVVGLPIDETRRLLGGFGLAHPPPGARAAALREWPEPGGRPGAGS